MLLLVLGLRDIQATGYLLGRHLPGSAFGRVVNRDEKQRCERSVAANSICILRVMGGLEREQIHS